MGKTACFEIDLFESLQKIENRATIKFSRNQNFKFRNIELKKLLKNLCWSSRKTTYIPETNNVLALYRCWSVYFHFMNVHLSLIA